MNPEPGIFTRREALLGTFKCAVAATLAIPVLTVASEPSPPPEPDYALENDYPFFGPEPASHARE